MQRTVPAGSTVRAVVTLTDEGSTSERVLGLARDPAMPPGLAAFAAAYLHRSGRDEDPDPVLAEVRCAYALLAGRERERSAVRAFNPTVERDGYERLNTVLEATTDDTGYLVDSVDAALRGRDLTPRLVIHPIVGVERDRHGAVERVLGARDTVRRESFMHFELDRRLEGDDLRDLEALITDVLAAVHVVVGDFPAMSQQLGRMIELARTNPGEDAEEAVTFLRWLVDGNFTFLGFRDAGADSGLGLLRDVDPEPRPASTDLLTVTKTESLSPVRRRARMDDIGIRATGGDLRLVGLFTRKAYAAPAIDTPLVNGKLRRILEAEDLMPGSHDHRLAVAIFSSFPKDELFQAPTEDLRAAVAGLLVAPGDEAFVLASRAAAGDVVRLTIAVPRRAFAGSLVDRLRKVVTGDCAGPVELESHLVVDEGLPHARVHIAVHPTAGHEVPDVDVDAIRAAVAELIRSWEDAVERELRDRIGAQRARRLVAAWAPRLPASYRAWTSPRLAAGDLERLAELRDADATLAVGLQDDGDRSRLTLVSRDGKVGLSEVLPTLEALGLRVDDERPAALTPGEDGTHPHLQVFGVAGPDGGPLDVGATGDRLAATILAVRSGRTEADGLSRLVLVAGLTWEQVAVLRAYRIFRQRASARFSLRHDAAAFAAHPQIARTLVDLFEARHGPGDDDGADLHAEILTALDAVQSLDEDRILRDQLTLVDATLRTNAFRPGRDALALKLRSGDIPGIPRPAPHVEVYVHSPQLEGIHLRGGPIARGGLRWSDRLDFRTEVFGLMRAQVTKNAVIVPTGAKGGFYLKQRPEDPGELRTAVETQYERFIQALLDITDDLDGAAVVHPEGVRVHDGDDPYLVVAADKGTATFSDTANAIAVQRGFWLGDAFASGGSEGYDHKRLGITARGAWESVKRHFRELGADPERDAVTIAGVGDMSGDVFGNGLLLSRSVRLIAAYDHRHVFVDPGAGGDGFDAEASWRERKRLFDLPRSSWADYDPGRISAGGGVWPRTAKAIDLPPEARAALGVEAERLTPDEVVQAILRAPVDLLFFGGIGTVVKATAETDADAKDRSSDAIRVDASTVRARVVTEGGNLGLTHRARIELAAAGTRVNADFIDNSAGVDCSDHEVNLKILVDAAVAAGRLDAGERHDLLRAATDDVVEHVLGDSYRQARILSREVLVSASRLYAYDDLMDALEREGRLRREADALPDAEELGRRRRAGEGLHRPELAVLLAHAKSSIADALLADDAQDPLIDDPWLERDLRAYFPPVIVERLGDEIGAHRLRRELVATLVANELVDAVGPSFVSRLATELGVAPVLVVRAYRIARDVVGATGRFAVVDALDAELDVAVEAELASATEDLVEAVTRAYVRLRPAGPLQPVVQTGHEGFEAIEDALEQRPPEHAETAAARLAERGVPRGLALDAALADDLAFAPDVLSVAEETGRDIDSVGMAFARIGDELRFGWLEAELDALPAQGRTTRWAVQALRDDARRARRDLVARALLDSPDAEAVEAVEAFLAAHTQRAGHLAEIARATSVEGADLAALLVVVRELRTLAG